jgi:tetratricopeptide (TPR) repeat protein
MRRCKYFILVAVSGVVLASCGGSSARKTLKGAKPHGALKDQITIPTTISSDERKIWEKNLYLLPVAHPARTLLRDRLAESVLSEFKRTDPDKVEQRLALFKEALYLHDATDFQAGRLCPEVTEMASWAVDVFEQRGDEAVVLAALRFLMLAEPENASYKERYLALSEWSKTVRNTIVGRANQLASLIDVYQGMVALVPDREVVEELAKLHIEHYEIIKAAFSSGGESGFTMTDPREILIHGRAIQDLPIHLIHIFFLAGDPLGARPYLEGLVADGNLHVGYIEMLDRIAAGEDLADSYFSLARSIVPLDPRAALKAYILARAADPTDQRFSLNIGLIFDELECHECAVDFYIESATIAPAEEVYTKVLELITKSLGKLHYAEQTSAAKRVIGQADALITAALKDHVDKASELRMIASSLLYTMGEVEFDDGRIESARGHFLKSHQIYPNVPALIKLQEVYYLLNDFELAMKIIERAQAVELDGMEISDYLRAVILEKRADLLLALKKKSEAEPLYREALAKLEAGGELMDSSPAVAIRRGVILHQLGKKDASQEAFRLAIRLDPDRAETYGTIISFLVVHGRLDDAVEFYRLSYNQDRIRAMWKIYYSLWIEGLSRRTGKGSVDLAKGYLESSNGESWQDHLAKFFCGKITLGDLKKAAKNTGQRVEVSYYGAIVAMADGNTAEARKMLGEVIDSKLLGFFEYRMAREILRDELK